MNPKSVANIRNKVAVNVPKNALGLAQDKAEKTAKALRAANTVLEKAQAAQAKAKSEYETARIELNKQVDAVRVATQVNPVGL